MTGVVQVFTKDKRFRRAVAKLVARFAMMQDEVVCIVIGPSIEYLDLRYRQQRSLTAIARQLHCSQRTLQRCHISRGHEFLYHELQSAAPDLARLFRLCIEQPN